MHNNTSALLGLLRMKISVDWQTLTLTWTFFKLYIVAVSKRELFYKSMSFLNKNIIKNGKGKAVFQKFEPPRFQDNRHIKMVRLSALRTDRLYPRPRKYFWYSFFVRGWFDHRGILRPEWSCQWKVPVPPSKIEPATFHLVAQCQPTAPPRALIFKNINGFVSLTAAEPGNTTRYKLLIHLIFLNLLNPD
jgi:hypothetical protein